MGKKKKEITPVTEEELEDLSSGMDGSITGPTTPNPWAKAPEWDDEFDKFAVFGIKLPIMVNTSNGKSWVLTRAQDSYVWQPIPYIELKDKKKKKAK